MNFKSILIIGLSMATLVHALPVNAVQSFPAYSVQSLPVNASYGVLYYFKGFRVLDLFTNHPGYRSNTNTSPTNVQNADADKNSNATDESLETKMKNAERLREYGDATRDIIRNMYP